MTEQERAEMEALLDMFAQPGWDVLVRHTEERIKSFQEGAPFNMENEAQLQYMKGVVATLRYLLALPDMVVAASTEEGE
jgi:hypothetical protein